MAIFLIWSLVAFVIGSSGLGHNILNKAGAFWAFVIFAIIPGFEWSETSKYGEISGVIYIPVSLVLISIFVILGELLVTDIIPFVKAKYVLFRKNIISKYLKYRPCIMKHKVLIKSVSICVSIIIVLGICIILYVSNEPYRDLEIKIDDKLLNEDTCNWNTEYYYEVLETNKGQKVIANKLEAYRCNNDIESALWLLSVLPSTLTETTLSNDVGRWIVDYADENGDYSTNKEYDDDYYYLTYYEMDDYRLVIPSDSSRLALEKLSVIVNTHASTNSCNQDENVSMKVAQTPYYGMNVSNINNTELGAYDERELCRDYYSLDYDHRSSTYYWYDENGNEIFSAYALAEKVISTTDRRDGEMVIDYASNYLNR